MTKTSGSQLFFSWRHTQHQFKAAFDHAVFGLKLALENGTETMPFKLSLHTRFPHVFTALRCDFL